MAIKWNKVTWYSKLLAIILAVVIFYVGFNLGQEKKSIDSTRAVPAKNSTNTISSITIKTQKIKEENFNATIPVISGPGPLPTEAKKYIDQTISDFRQQANTDVPPMRAKFGTDSPMANYEIGIEAKYIKGGKTESVVMTVSTYTGGAHGSSLYKVLTASLADKKILNLSNIIQKDQQSAFTEFVKKRLNAWRPEGSGGPVVFPEDVASLKFDSFVNWSLDDKNLIIYFGQGEISPEVFGSPKFPFSLEKIKNFLDSAFN